jgi:ATP-binding cassette, subfamily B, bacterial PglK
MREKMFGYISRILYVVTGSKNRLLLMALVFIAVSLLDTVGIGLIGPFMGLATAPDLIFQKIWLNNLYVHSGLKTPYQFISLLGFAILLIFYLKSFLNFRMQEQIFKFSLGQSGKLVERLLKAYLSADYTFHLQRNTSAILQTLVVETSQFSNSVLIPLLVSVSNAAVLFFLLSLLMITSLVGTTAILGVILLAFLISNLFKNRMSRWNQEAAAAQDYMIRTINHSVGGIKETKVIGCESYFEGQIAGLAKTYAVGMGSVLAYGNLPRVLVEAFLITFLIGFTSIYLSIGQRPQELTAVLSIFAVASIRMFPATSALLSGIITVRTSKYIVDKIYLDLKEVEGKEKSDRKFSDVSSPGKNNRVPQLDRKPMAFSTQVVLSQISYSYPEATKPSVQNICLTLKRGQAIALIGKSGAGKTTLVDVILGLLRPQTGDLKVDGVSVYDDLRQWQNLIGYIPQSIFLMDDTLERNIAFGVPDEQIDTARLRKAIEAAQLSQLVDELADGVNTQLGERGVRLSGGQRQRIGIARALYHEREILVLDEATAALDNETERLVNDSIKALSGQKTLIIIAHRLTTVKHCDRIYLMEQGKIAKEGSYAEIVLGESTVV